MKKSAYFDEYWGDGWPAISYLEPYFISPPGKEWFFESTNDGAILKAEGVDGTEHLQPNKGRIDIRLWMWGHPKHGVLLIHEKVGPGRQVAYSSKGDLSRLKEHVRTLHGDLRPVGLFIPFAKAWPAVKEFIETQGALPTSIEWIANADLPPNTFPDP